MQKYKMGVGIEKNVVIAVILAVIIAIFAISSPFIASAVKKNNSKVIVVDAGHGGVDGGVTGTKTGVKESDLNLQVANILKEYLSAGGYYVVMTRVSDNELTLSKSTGSRKRDDMFRRGEIINDSKPAAVVSIHMNFYTAASRRGAQVFFNKKNELSHSFGDNIQEFLNRDINSRGGGREYTALHAEKYILECTSVPVAIVECGFLSNPVDEANLSNPKYQSELAYSVFQAITSYLSNVA